MASGPFDVGRQERVRLGLFTVVAWALGACGSPASGAENPPSPQTVRVDGSVLDAGARPIADATTDAPSAPMGADSSDESDAPMDATSAGEAASCTPASSPASFAGAAQSAGFSGSDSAYYALYDDTCQTTTDCEEACVSAGGTSASCSAASMCPSESDGHGMCVPPSYWLNVAGALSQSSSSGSPGG